MTQNAKLLTYLESRRTRPGKGGVTHIKYRCVCGKTAWMLQSSWSKQQSCGCLTNSILSKARTIHGHSHPNGSNGSPTYLSWLSMNDRCYYKPHKSYKDYGGRGIKVCERWRFSFVNFLADMGDRPSGKTIGRLDNDGDYTPGNCAWVTYKEQARNRRTNRLLTFQGVTQTLQEWSEKIGVPRDAIGRRLSLGWPLERALTEPLRPQKNTRYRLNKVAYG